MAPGSRGVGAVFSCTFPAKIPVKRGMLSANREFHVVAGVVIFPTHPGSRMLQQPERLCARRRLSGRKNAFLRVFSQILSQFARIFDLAPDVRDRRKACAAYFCKVPAEIRAWTCGYGCFWPCTEASLGSQDMILRTGGRRNVPYAKGGGQFDSVFGLVNGPVKPWSNLVNLGQTWSNLVKALQTLGKCIPDRISRVSGHGGSLVGLETARSNLGQTLVNPRSNLVKGRLGSGCLVLRADTRENPGGTARNPPQFACHSLSDALALNRLTHGSKV
uniref:Uncharacterized protein n=1 Tax=Fagus sylvatica TaxID=28930 RepID=A0A2N9GWX4_FAGSY